MATAELNGVEIYFQTAGAGERLILTHGSWTDGSGWAAATDVLSDRYEVVTWDRRGHSRSRAGEGPGSRAEDAADLAALIEHLGDVPVHLAGNSYGSIVVLDVVTSRPELVASAAVHEPPVLALLEGSHDPRIAAELAEIDGELSVVTALIEAERHRDAAERFIDAVALGPGSWDHLPETLQAVLEGNALTFLDERRDPTSTSVDAAALAATDVPLLLTRGTESPHFYAEVIDELALLVPTARVRSLAGAGHIPHATHPDEWAATVVDFHSSVPILDHGSSHSGLVL